MAIPLMVTPEFTTTIPSTEQKIKFRPFLVKEEKILFMALEGGDGAEIIDAVRNVLRNCILDDQLDISKLATFDIEYLFLQLRGKSVGEIIELNLKHNNNTECSHVTPHEVQVDDIKVIFPEDVTDKVMIDDNIGIKLRYPSLESLKSAEQYTKTNMNNIISFIADHVDFVFDKENVYDHFTKTEVVDFIESLNSIQFQQITKFFNNTPELKHDLKWTCPSCSQQESVVLRGLQSFFI